MKLELRKGHDLCLCPATLALQLQQQLAYRGGRLGPMSRRVMFVRARHSPWLHDQGTELLGLGLLR